MAIVDDDEEHEGPSVYNFRNLITAKDALAADLAKLTPARVRSASVKELDELAGKIRHFLIDAAAGAGGHLASNLATVELSLALHRVFESPQDTIIWDGGHQGYAHKLITGRADRFRTLNTLGGMSRFISKSESEHDVIEASHGGTSISVALGVALAKALRGDTRSVVAVIGDGSLAEGMALEGLNHAAVATHTNLVIVLNDNGSATNPAFGALHDYVQSLQPGQADSERLFTALGLDYIGPIDGHNIEATVKALERAKESTQIPFVHVRTEKGRGWKGKTSEGAAYVGYHDVAATVVSAEMERDERIVAIAPSTLDGAGLHPVFKKFPDRAFDPGLEEQHALTLATGFAVERCKPVIFFQSTFLQRAFDQLVHDVCFGNIPVLILSVRSGFAGSDSPTRHGIYDFAYWRGLPNLRVLYPKDRHEAERMVRDELRGLVSPTIIAMPHGTIDDLDPVVKDEPAAQFKKPQTVLAGKDVTIVAVGHKFKVARDAAERMRRKGVAAGLVNLRYLKPLPEEPLAEILGRALRVVTIEEGVLDGGVGSAITAFAADRKLKVEILRLGLPCAFIAAGTQDELCRLHGLDVDGVLQKIREFWKLDV
jgi:1-deoxy-D-xylulose-5-phosphate synthase